MSDTETVSMALTLPSRADEVRGGDVAAPDAFEDDARYYVVFAEVVDVPPFRYSPGNGELNMKGSVLNRILEEKGPDVFRSAVKR